MWTVYKITNTVNNRIYIGVTDNYQRRKTQHFWLLKLGKHSSKGMQSDYNAGHLFRMDEVLSCLISKQAAMEVEAKCIKENNSICYNKAHAFDKVPITIYLRKSVINALGGKKRVREICLAAIDERTYCLANNPIIKPVVIPAAEK